MRIALVEDNRALADGVAAVLTGVGHAVDLLRDGAAADAHLAAEGADLVILDINLPKLDGLAVLRRLRARGDQTPVLLLTARGETGDRVIGLDAGADDYLVKPFEMAELEARLRALTRRRARTASQSESIGSLRYERGARRVFCADEELELPRKELALFECLIERRGQIVAKWAIADHLYGTGAGVEEHVVEVYVSRLRKRLAAHGVTIRTARGLGYMMDDH